METSKAQPTSNIAFALETVNKGTRQVTKGTAAWLIAVYFNDFYRSQQL